MKCRPAGSETQRWRNRKGYLGPWLALIPFPFRATLSMMQRRNPPVRSIEPYWSSMDRRRVWAMISRSSWRRIPLFTTPPPWGWRCCCIGSVLCPCSTWRPFNAIGKMHPATSPRILVENRSDENIDIMLWTMNRTGPIKRAKMQTNKKMPSFWDICGYGWSSR